MFKSRKRSVLSLLNLFILFALLSLAACGGSIDTGGGGSNTTVVPSTIDLVASPPTVASDGSTSSTITITAKNSSNAALSGVEITMSADTGNVSPATVTTADDGTATATYSAGSNPTNRTAIVTAAAGAVSASIPIEVVGSTVTIVPSGTTLTTAGTDSIKLTITAKNSGNVGVNGATVTLTQSSTNGGSVSFSPATGTTATVDSVAGVFESTVTGVTAGNVTVTARALGEPATANLIVTTPVETFAIDQQTLCNPGCAVLPDNPNPSSMVDGNTLAIRANIPTAYAADNVVFVSTYGSFVESGSFIASIAPPFPGGKATATLQTSSVGTATVQAYISGHESIKDTLTVYMLSANLANSIILQATPTVVSLKTDTSTGTSTITATVRDASIPAVPVANVPVAFSLLNPTGGGETLSSAVAMTGLDGTATTTFTAGTLPSFDAGGVKIHAQVVGTTVETGVAPSGNDASVVIGGKGGSVAFGLATALAETGGSPPASYIQVINVLVSDINGNPVPNAKVSISVWPIAWSTGVDDYCSWDADDGVSKGTFLNEDVNENLILNSYGNPYYLDGPLYANPPYDEDGLRQYFYSPGTYASYATGGTKDGALTPANSAAGSVSPVSPATEFVTGSNGVAVVNLTYPKNSAIWTVVRLRASTIVQGSETVGQIIFRLSALQNDVSPCKLECLYSF